MDNVNYLDIIEKAAKHALEKHIQFSNSLDGNPSDDQFENIEGDILYAYIRTNYTADEYKALSDENKREINVWAHNTAAKAMEIADRKWEAAVTLLGL